MADPRRSFGWIAVLALSWLAASHTLVAQEADPVQDNSFLVEEAYNQDPGVVQHISTFSRGDDHSWLYTFTQEWPLRGLRHQVSYTIPLQHDDGTGLGDILLNYRLQALGDGKSFAAFSPRLSVLLPTGSSSSGRGAGGPGIQVGLPVNLQLSSRLTAVLNAGLTYIPRTKNPAGDHAATVGYNLGGSAIVYLTPALNLLLESIWLSSEDVTGPGHTGRHEEAYLNPGVRWGFNRGELQIVPGVAYTIGVGPTRGSDALFLYLSFEHPFGHHQ